MSANRRRRFRRAAVAVALSTATATALSGCGLAEDGFRPGAAAQVGEVTIGLDEVDASAEDFCELITVLAEEGATSAVPGSLVRDNSLQYAVLREFADQLADEYDVEVGDYYQSAAEQAEGQLIGLGVEGALLERVLPHITSDQYFLDVVQQIGRIELGSGAGATGEAAAAEGLRVAQTWENEVGLQVNPRFADIHIGDLDQYVRSDIDDLSVPVGDFAKNAAAAAEPGNADPAFVESLPESQRCG